MDPQGRHAAQWKSCPLPTLAWFAPLRCRAQSIGQAVVVNPQCLPDSMRSSRFPVSPSHRYLIDSFIAIMRERERQKNPEDGRAAHEFADDIARKIEEQPEAGAMLLDRSVKQNRMQLMQTTRKVYMASEITRPLSEVFQAARDRRSAPQLLAHPSAPVLRCDNVLGALTTKPGLKQDRACPASSQPAKRLATK